MKKKVSKLLNKCCNAIGGYCHIEIDTMFNGKVIDYSGYTIFDFNSYKDLKKKVKKFINETD